MKKQKGQQSKPIEHHDNAEQRTAVMWLLNSFEKDKGFFTLPVDLVLSRILPYLTTVQLSTLFRNNKVLLEWVREKNVWKQLALLHIPQEQELKYFERIILEIVVDAPINYKWLLYIWEQWHFVQSFDFSNQEIFVGYHFVEKEQEYPLFPISSDSDDGFGEYFPTNAANTYINHDLLRLSYTRESIGRSCAAPFLKHGLDTKKPPTFYDTEAEIVLKKGDLRNFILILYTAFSFPGVYIQRIIEETEETEDKIRSKLVL